MSIREHREDWGRQPDREHQEDGLVVTRAGPLYGEGLPVATNARNRKTPSLNTEVDRKGVAQYCKDHRSVQNGHRAGLLDQHMAKRKKKKAGPVRKKSRIDPRLVKALGHPMRLEILEVLERGIASPTEVSDVLNIALQHVSYHMRTLAACDCIELVHTRPVRGAQEHFYRPKPKASIGHPNWQVVPRALVGDLVFSVLQEFVRKVVLALKAGTIGSYEETPLGSMTIMVDELGRDQALGIVHDAQARLSEIDAASRERSSEGDSLTPYVTGWALFPAAHSPKTRGDL